MPEICTGCLLSATTCLNQIWLKGCVEGTPQQVRGLSVSTQPQPQTGVYIGGIDTWSTKVNATFLTLQGAVWDT